MSKEVKTLYHPLLGNLVPAQAPLATYLSDDDDFDLALYVDNGTMLVKLELDWPSRSIPGLLMEIEKELVIAGNYLAVYGRGATVNEFERVFDVVASTQLEFVSIAKRVEMRNAISKLLEEYFEKLDAGVFDSV